MSKKVVFPEWGRILYRGLRAAVAAGVAQVLLIRPDLGNPQELARTIAVAFLTGFLPSFGMWLRDFLDEKFGYGERSLVQKVMPI